MTDRGDIFKFCKCTEATWGFTGADIRGCARVGTVWGRGLFQKASIRDEGPEDWPWWQDFCSKACL